GNAALYTQLTLALSGFLRFHGHDCALGGRLGMSDFVEPRVRRLVADHLGVGTEELTRDVSLADELAVDSLDLVELALALEAEFGISMSEATLDEVRTYGELAD